MTDDTELDELEPDTEAPAPEGIPDPGDELRKDVEEAVGQQLAKKGAPNPYEGLEGRQDTGPGGRYEGLETFAEEARRNGTSIQSAVRDYAEAEKALRKDFAGGVEHICQKMGVDPRALVGVLHQRYYGPNANYHAQAMAQQHQQAQVDTGVAEFFAKPKNAHFVALRPAMYQLVASGKATTLEEAASKALKANPTYEAKTMIARKHAKRDADMRSMKPPVTNYSPHAVYELGVDQEFIIAVVKARKADFERWCFARMLDSNDRSVRDEWLRLISSTEVMSSTEAPRTWPKKELTDMKAAVDAMSARLGAQLAKKEKEGR